MRISFVKAVGAGPELASLFFPSLCDLASLYLSLAEAFSRGGFLSLWLPFFLAEAAQMCGSFCVGQLLLDFQAINKKR